MEDALKGVTILEVGVMTPGKYCGFLMCGWGAVSIRVERPGQDGELSTEDLLLNQGKQSIALNLRAPEGRDILLRLCETADVLVESYRPGVTTRLGIDYETVRAVNEKLVYCSLSGFGQDGPDHMQPGYDLLFQARSGMSHAMTNDIPISPKTWLSDSVSGLMSAFAIAAALRKREATDLGTYIDLAMLDSLFSLFSVSHGTLRGKSHFDGDAVENWANRPINNIYRAGDGRYLALTATRDVSCRTLFAHLGRPDLADIALVRGGNNQAAFEFLADAFRAKPAKAWVDTLTALDIEIAEVNTPEEAFDDPQLNSRGMIKESTHPDAGTIRQIGMPAAPSLSRPPAPAIGQDTATILRTLGYGDTEISDLRDGNVI